MIRKASIALVLAFGLAACGGGGDDDGGGGGEGGGGGAGNIVSGMAFKGPFTSGTVAAFVIESNGALGATLGSGPIGSDGSFSVDVGSHTGPLILRASGGAFLDEATGNTNQSAELYAALPATAATNTVNITPLTSIIASRARRWISLGSDATMAIGGSATEVGNWFGISDVHTAVPADLAGGPVAGVNNAAEYGAILAGISQLALSLGVGSDQLAAALADDAADGDFDGADGATTIALGASTLSPTTAQGELSIAIGDFLASAANASGLTAVDFDPLIQRLANRPDTLLFVMSIDVSPKNLTVAASMVINYAAQGTFSDGTTSDITATATWDSTNTNVASITQTGVATAGTIAGTVDITATQDNAVGSTQLTVTTANLVSIEVLPANPTLFVSDTQQFTAMGTYSDSSVIDITAAVDWDSSNSTALNLSASGFGTALAAGTSTVTATDTATAIFGNTVVDVLVVTLVSIEVTPATPVIYAGNTQQFTAMGTYNDNSVVDITASVTWQSSAAGSLDINAAGLATALATGTPTITATDPGTMIDGDTVATVHGLVSIAVTPGSPLLYITQTQQFTATATYSDTTTQNITSAVNWLSGTPTVMSLTSAGLGTAQDAGTSQISATEPVTSVSGNTTATVFVSYTNNIQPIFNANCIGCHPPEQGLTLTTYAGLMAGGNAGPAVIVNDANNSLLIKMLEGTEPGRPQMPNGGPPLPQATIDMVKAWINAGAVNN